jgi:hypothetical protein
LHTWACVQSPSEIEGDMTGEAGRKTAAAAVPPAGCELDKIGRYPSCTAPHLRGFPLHQLASDEESKNKADEIHGCTAMEGQHG